MAQDNAAATAEAASARITKHMNGDHADAVRDYAEFFARLPRAVARTAVLTGVSLDALELTVTSPSSSQPHGAQSTVQSTVRIPLSPPMASFADARERLAAMALEAVEGLGRRSPPTVERWVAPGPLGALVWAGVGLGYWAYWNSAREFAPGGFLRRTLFRGPVEPLADVFLAYGHTLFWVILAVHVLEAVWIHHSRLTRHGVATGSALWWLWVLTTFAEGFGSILRFDAEVRRLERGGKAGKNH